MSDRQPTKAKETLEKHVKKLVTSHCFWHEFDAGWTTVLQKATCHLSLEKFQPQLAAQFNDTIIKRKIGKADYNRHELSGFILKISEHCSHSRVIYNSSLGFRPWS